ncbi:unnamed protein product [Lepeophtheirus salmonis]|uniref:(salmon louse) hypothetical protein n=1 Tax=Lepeophtheirus salmonis TaxID=72036 RepID=A0A7R8D2M2_LEPSM|nr:unnamed protein product [Lepeophtheirus salmonis]CAF3007095.1 unnamed protein product [Lepeophtheirus salmonis]
MGWVCDAKNKVTKNNAIKSDSHSKSSSTKEKEHSHKSKAIPSEYHSKSTSTKDKLEDKGSLKSSYTTSGSPSMSSSNQVKRKYLQSSSKKSELNTNLFEIEDNVQFEKSGSKTYEFKSSCTKDIFLQHLSLIPSHPFTKIRREDLESKIVDSSVSSIQDKTELSKVIELKVTPLNLKLNTSQIKTVIKSSLSEAKLPLTTQFSVDRSDVEYKKHISKLNEMNHLL